MIFIPDFTQMNYLLTTMSVIQEGSVIPRNPTEYRRHLEQLVCSTSERMCHITEGSANYSVIARVRCIEPEMSVSGNDDTCE
jgi:hypothetical protein